TTTTISGLATGSYTYTVTNAAGCTSVASAPIVINVQPVTPTAPVVGTITQPTCTVATGSVALSGLPAAGTWTLNPGGITGTGTTTTISGLATGSYTYTVTNAAGCTSVASAPIVINAQPATPQIMLLTSTNSICSGDVASITVGSNLSGTAYSWTVVQTGVTGAIAGSGASIAQTLTATGTVTGTAIYTIVPTANGCTGTPISVTINVKPAPVAMANPSNLTICSGESINIPLSSTIAGTTYSWTVSQVGASGAAAGSGSVISHSIIATGSTMGMVTYTVTPSYNGCSGTPINVIIRVTPKATMTATPASLSICSGGTASVSFSGSLPGTTFNWNVVQSNVTGATSGTGNSLSQVLTTIGNNIGQAVYTVVPVVNGCPGTPVAVTVQVNPIPVVTATPTSQTICSGTQTGISLTSTIPNTTYTWAVVQTGVLGAASGSGNTIAQTLTTIGTTAGTVNYIITPHANGCSGNPITVTVNVNPVPEVFTTTGVTTICSGEPTAIGLSAIIPATTFSWTVTQNGVSGASDGTGVLIAQELITTGNQPGQAIYVVTPLANGCVGNSITVVITVNPLPEPELVEGHICINPTTGEVINTYTLNTGINNSSNIYVFEWYHDGVLVETSANSSYLVNLADNTVDHGVGEYNVLVMNSLTGCVSEVIAPVQVTVSTAATPVQIYTNEAFSDNPTLTVVVTGGSHALLYSLDGGAYQSSNVFTNVTTGSHTVHIVDEESCTDFEMIKYVIGYPHFFTPNGDGYNDYWNIKDLIPDNPNAEILIFDRYGKLVKQLTPSTPGGWDGTLNGSNLPATDYWFTVRFNDGPQKTERIFKSHFSLKR
ncbi:T9SS type B sorting domain-containing protein, partial [Flavobacterium sp. SM15]|uniref:PKD-like domain-containing protein n=1 Tax=Flavobacterium sp. SM15 TaxID=2908005 RepID=UPI001EDB2B56